ncbi:MAG: hypothetical protein ACR2GY_10510 [Phycisphaerales bacterium]
MTLIQDIRGVFTRRKHVVVDLTNTQAEGLADSMTEAKPSSSQRGSSLDRPRSVPASSNMEEVMTLVRNMSSHLEQQTSRTDRLVECMERLPDALDALPEINRQNARLLEVVSDYLDHARQRDHTLNETLDNMHRASSRQTEVLGLLHQQLDTSDRATEHLVQGMSQFREGLTQLATANESTTKVLHQLHRASEQRESELTRVLSNTQRWMIAAMVASAVVAMSAIGMAGFAIFGR